MTREIKLLKNIKTIIFGFTDQTGMQISVVGARDVHAIANVKGLRYISGVWRMRKAHPSDTHTHTHTHTYARACEVR